MLRADTSYEIVWDGSKAHNRGYLATVADELKDPPVVRPLNLGDWRVHPIRKVTLLDRVIEALTLREMTSQQLQEALSVPQSNICIAITAIRQTGKLRERHLTSTHPRARGKSYWIVP